MFTHTLPFWRNWCPHLGVRTISFCVYVILAVRSNYIFAFRSAWLVYINMSHPRTLSTIRQLRYDLPNGEGVLTRRDKINLHDMFDGMTFNIERHELVVSNLRGKPDRYIERAAETAMDVISRNELRHPRNTARDRSRSRHGNRFLGIQCMPPSTSI